MPKTSDKRKIVLYVSPIKFDELKTEADKRDISISSYVKALIFEKKEEKKK